MLRNVNLYAGIFYNLLGLISAWNIDNKQPSVGKVNTGNEVEYYPPLLQYTNIPLEIYLFYTVGKFVKFLVLQSQN